MPRVPINPRKLALARVFDATGLNGLLLRTQAALLGPHARCVNYHAVPPELAPGFERQLRDFARRFVPVGAEELRDLLAGRWRHKRPGLIVSFDDGLRSHFDVAAPLLERYGFPGWFFVPVGFVETAPERQAEFAREHRIQPRCDRADRLAMTWEELRRLDTRHVIGCHTMHHRRLSAALTPTELREEIVEARRMMEERLGRPVEIFAWVGGEERAYSAAAAATIRDAGFAVSFMTNNAVIRPGSDRLQLQRTNVEADWPMPLVRFQLSGFLDVMYAPKRRRVNRLTAAPQAG